MQSAILVSDVTNTQAISYPGDVTQTHKKVVLCITLVLKCTVAEILVPYSGGKIRRKYHIQNC